MARRVDVPGQVLVIVFLASLTYGIIESPAKGWSSILIIGAFAVAAVSLLAFVVWEHRAGEPLIDLRFFHSIDRYGFVTPDVNMTWTLPPGSLRLARPPSTNSG